MNSRRALGACYGGAAEERCELGMHADFGSADDVVDDISVDIG